MNQQPSNLKEETKHLKYWKDIIKYQNQEITVINEMTQRINSLNKLIYTSLEKIDLTFHSLLIEKSNEDPFKIVNLAIITVNFYRNILNSSMLMPLNNKLLHEIYTETLVNNRKLLDKIDKNLFTLICKAEDLKKTHKLKLEKFEKQKSVLEELYLEKKKLNEKISSAYNVSLRGKLEEQILDEFKEHQKLENEIVSIQKDFEETKNKAKEDFEKIAEEIFSQSFENNIINNQLLAMISKHNLLQLQEAKGFVSQTLQSLEINNICLDEYIENKTIKMTSINNKLCSESVCENNNNNNNNKIKSSKENKEFLSNIKTIDGIINDVECFFCLEDQELINNFKKNEINLQLENGVTDTVLVHTSSPNNNLNNELSPSDFPELKIKYDMMILSALLEKTKELENYYENYQEIITKRKHSVKLIFQFWETCISYINQVKGGFQDFSQVLIEKIACLDPKKENKIWFTWNENNKLNFTETTIYTRHTTFLFLPGIQSIVEQYRKLKLMFIAMKEKRMKVIENLKSKLQKIYNRKPTNFASLNASISIIHVELISNFYLMKTEIEGIRAKEQRHMEALSILIIDLFKIQYTKIKNMSSREKALLNIINTNDLIGDFFFANPVISFYIKEMNLNPDFIQESLINSFKISFSEILQRRLKGMERLELENNEKTRFFSSQTNKTSYLFNSQSNRENSRIEVKSELELDENEQEHEHDLNTALNSNFNAHNNNNNNDNNNEDEQNQNNNIGFSLNTEKHNRSENKDQYKEKLNSEFAQKQISKSNNYKNINNKGDLQMIVSNFEFESENRKVQSGVKKRIDVEGTPEKNNENKALISNKQIKPITGERENQEAFNNKMTREEETKLKRNRKTPEEQILITNNKFPTFGLDDDLKNSDPNLKSSELQQQNNIININEAQFEEGNEETINRKNSSEYFKSTIIKLDNKNTNNNNDNPFHNKTGLLTSKELIISTNHKKDNENNKLLQFNKSASSTKLNLITKKPLKSQFSSSDDESEIHLSTQKHHGIVSAHASNNNSNANIANLNSNAYLRRSLPRFSFKNDSILSKEFNLDIKFDPKKAKFSNIPDQEAKTLRDNLLKFTASSNNTSSPEKKHTVNLHDNEILLDSFNCAFVDGILLQGEIYVTTRKLTFKSWFNSKTLFGKTLLEIPYLEIEEILKSYILKIFDNTIKIKTKKGELLFTSFVNRDKCFKLISDTYFAFKVDNPELFEAKETKDKDSLMLSNVFESNLETQNNISKKITPISIVKSVAVGFLSKINFLHRMEQITQKRLRDFESLHLKIIDSHNLENKLVLEDYKGKNKKYFKGIVYDEEFISNLPISNLVTSLLDDATVDCLGYNNDFWTSVYKRRKCLDIEKSVEFQTVVKSAIGKPQEQLTLEDLESKTISLKDYFKLTNREIFDSNMEEFYNVFFISKKNLNLKQNIDIAINSTNLNKTNNYTNMNTENSVVNPNSTVNNTLNYFERFLEKIENWDQRPFMVTFKFKQPLKKRMFVPEITRIKLTLFVNFISPTLVIIDEISKAYDIAYSDTFYTHNQYRLNTKISFENGMFKFKSYFSDYLMLEFTKSCFIHSIILSEGLKEGPDAIVTHTFPCIKIVGEDSQSEFLEKMSFVQKENYKKIVSANAVLLKEKGKAFVETEINDENPESTVQIQEEGKGKENAKSQSTLEALDSKSKEGSGNFYQGITRYNRAVRFLKRNKNAFYKSLMVFALLVFVFLNVYWYLNGLKSLNMDNVLLMTICTIFVVHKVVNEEFDNQLE